MRERTPSAAALALRAQRLPMTAVGMQAVGLKASWLTLVLLIGLQLVSATAEAGAPANMLYPDMFPFVDENAPSSMRTLQDWTLNGSTLEYRSMFANQGDGYFEIRRGPDIDSEFYTLQQRVYIDNDLGANFVDIPIGTAAIPGSAGNPSPNIPPSHNQQSNLMWFEDFTKFSLHEAPVVDGLLTVGAEVASTVKASWRLSNNRGPLPGYSTSAVNGDQSTHQRIAVGWADMYSSGPGQSFDISGVPAGPSYWLRQTVDPTNRLQETDETNNSFEILIDLNNPGEAFMVAGQFVQPGDPVPTEPGDLNEDGQINLTDWIAFQSRAAVDLDGLTPEEALLQGDLDLNGQHGLSDYVMFREAYDLAQGVGAFAALQHAVPEPSALASLIVGVSLVLSRRSGHRRDLWKADRWQPDRWSSG